MRVLTRQSFTAIASAVTMPSSVRAISAKRMSRVRTNWFVIGTLFGIGSSFFMNMMVTTVIMPQYQEFAKRRAAPQPTSIEVAKPLFDSPSLLEAHASLMAAIPKFDKFQTIDLEVEPGDTLLDMLIAQKVDEQEAHEVITALRKEFNPRSLRVGQKISLKLARHETVGDKNAVKELAINLPNLSTVELKFKDGMFNVAAIKAELEDHAMRATGTVRTSLYQAAYDAGIPNSVMGEVVQAFSYDVDFQRDVHPGDKIEVIMDRRETKEGKIAGHGNARYAALTLGKSKIEIFRFTDQHGRDNWYNAKGENVVKSLLMTPIHAARITSGFGMRRHPILGYGRMHRGVDFGARTGTPILAAGDGVVTYRGWKGGYGNYVQIRHNGTYSTAYGHCSRFANIKVGSRVKQGQVIAYVGSTGQSTGPHLHYEVHQNGAQVNPRNQKFNTSQALAGADLAKFKTRMGELMKERASLSPTSAPLQQVASR